MILNHLIVLENQYLFKDVLNMARWLTQGSSLLHFFLKFSYFPVSLCLTDNISLICKAKAQQELRFWAEWFRHVFCHLGRGGGPASARQTANLCRSSVSCSGVCPQGSKDSLRGCACHLACQAVARRAFWLCSWMWEWTSGQV